LHAKLNCVWFELNVMWCDLKCYWISPCSILCRNLRARPVCFFVSHPVEPVLLLWCGY
jgi:hypothetical protein